MEKDYRYFSFAKFLKKLKEEKKDTVMKYMEKFNITPDTPIEEHPFYKNYLSKFKFDWTLAFDEDIDDIFGTDDWDLLQKLIFASMSSKYRLSLDEKWKANPVGKPVVHLNITVQHNEAKITKDIEELWAVQIFNLFKIYIDEQINLFMLSLDDDEKINYEQETSDLVDKFNKTKKNLLREIEMDTNEDELPAILKKVAMA